MVIDPGDNYLHDQECDARCKCQNTKYHHFFQWRNTALYQVVYCHTCNDIKAFHWKSFWRRLKGLFINETF